MLDTKVIAEQMRQSGMTEVEIRFLSSGDGLLHSLESVSEAFTRMLDAFEDTHMALVFSAPRKVERGK
jgi:hypothetical protein